MFSVFECVMMDLCKGYYVAPTYVVTFGYSFFIISVDESVSVSVFHRIFCIVLV
jgi:hypothetical protein